jgi:hypothetical protein
MTKTLEKYQKCSYAGPETTVQNRENEVDFFLSYNVHALGHLSCQLFLYSILSQFQNDMVRLTCAQHSPTSYIAGSSCTCYVLHAHCPVSPHKNMNPVAMHVIRKEPGTPKNSLEYSEHANRLYVICKFTYYSLFLDSRCHI